MVLLHHVQREDKTTPNDTDDGDLPTSLILAVDKSALTEGQLQRIGRQNLDVASQPKETNTHLPVSVAKSVLTEEQLQRISKQSPEIAREPEETSKGQPTKMKDVTVSSQATKLEDSTQAIKLEEASTLVKDVMISSQAIKVEEDLSQAIKVEEDLSQAIKLEEARKLAKENVQLGNVKASNRRVVGTTQWLELSLL